MSALTDVFYSTLDFRQRLAGYSRAGVRAFVDMEALHSCNSKDKTMSITVPKFPISSDDINLAVSLQYGTAQGIVQLQNPCASS